MRERWGSAKWISLSDAIFGGNEAVRLTQRGRGSPAHCLLYDGGNIGQRRFVTEVGKLSRLYNFVDFLVRLLENLWVIHEGNNSGSNGTHRLEVQVAVLDRKCGSKTYRVRTSWKQEWLRYQEKSWKNRMTNLQTMYRRLT